jgi:hypothetical protein
MLVLSGLSADRLEWSVGGGLRVIFLWLISVPPAGERDDDRLPNERHDAAR